jgi:PhoH-like ATPase
MHSLQILSFIDDHLVQSITEKPTFLKKLPTTLALNSFVLLKDSLEVKKILCRVVASQTLLKVVSLPDRNYFGISSKDAYQAAFLECLSNSKIKVSVCIGEAGTGKTTLALSYALQMFSDNDMRIRLSKPTALVGAGNTFGPVPGDVDEKYAPHTISYEMILNKLLGNRKGYLSMLKKKEVIKFEPVEFTRGNTYENTIFILDEAQNLSWHELKTVVSRIAENSKMIILGDPYQIDTGNQFESTGLYRMLNSIAFNRSEITSSIRLERQYRGPLPTLISNIDKELKECKGRKN